MTTSTSGFIIRDGLPTDIPACLNLDHSYETERVWQMRFAEETHSLQITFKTERLPRIMEAEYPVDEKRLRLALDQCFLVAVLRDQPEVLGYLVMLTEPVYNTAIVHDLVVTRPFRQRHIGTRLLNVARRWAREHDMKRLSVAIQTKNYPAIMFCQQAGMAFSGFNDHYFPNQDIAVMFTQAL